MRALKIILYCDKARLIKGLFRPNLRLLWAFQPGVMFSPELNAVRRSTTAWLFQRFSDSKDEISQHLKLSEQSGKILSPTLREMLHPPSQGRTVRIANRAAGSHKNSNAHTPLAALHPPPRHMIEN